MRIKKDSFEWTLHEIKTEHESNASDRINPVAAQYFSEVSKVHIEWWQNWLKDPHTADKVTVSHHQLTLFAAVISKHERALCANVARSLGGTNGDNIATMIENYTYYDWWPSEFPMKPI